MEWEDGKETLTFAHQGGMKAVMKNKIVLMPTFKLYLQHFILVVNDVTIWVEGVAGTVHADFQAQISS